MYDWLKLIVLLTQENLCSSAQNLWQTNTVIHNVHFVSFVTVVLLATLALPGPKSDACRICLG